ncbi:MAG: BamA/TamA family outer membrane protein [Candidatus Krumholzibacteriota bacterium]
MTLRSLHLVMVAAILLTGMSAGFSQAQGNGEWESYNGWKIKSFAVEGMPRELERGLQRGLAQSGKWKLLGGMQRPDFSVKTLAEDLARIRLFLAQNGYPAATVEPVAVPETEARQLDLVLRVVPGNPVRIGRIEYDGWPEAIDFPDTTDNKTLTVGEIFSDVKVVEAHSHLKQHLLDSGFATVEVTYTLEPMGPGLVAVLFEVTPGEFYRITRVEIRGCSDDLMKVARRVMNIEAGVDYSLQLISNASLDLRSTQLFSMVVLEVEPVGPGELKLVANLENGRMKMLEAGVGTFSDNPWLVRGGWRHRNLFGHGVGFDVAGVVGTHRLGAGAGVNWLGILSPRARTRAGLGFLVEDEDAYLSHESRVELIQSFRPRNRNIWNLGLTFSFTDVNRVIPEASDVPESQGRLMEIWTDVKWDRTNDPLFPETGGYLKTSFTVAPPGFFSEIPYVAIQGDASVYRTPVEPVVIAGRVRVGWETPLGEAVEVLATRRFYAGGYNTHRGYGRRKLGPLDAGGNALGGEFVALAGLEVRFPLIWILETAVFADAGQVWDKPREATLAGIPLAIGVDLDLRTPLGPVRAGYGWNVSNRIEGQPRDIFHFGIGYPW